MQRKVLSREIFSSRMKTTGAQKGAGKGLLLLKSVDTSLLRLLKYEVPPKVCERKELEQGGEVSESLLENDRDPVSPLFRGI